MVLTGGIVDSSMVVSPTVVLVDVPLLVVAVVAVLALVLFKSVVCCVAISRVLKDSAVLTWLAVVEFVVELVVLSVVGCSVDVIASVVMEVVDGEIVPDVLLPVI